MNKKLICLLLAFLESIIVPHAYDQSLKDCKAVAAEFKNTCVHSDYATPGSMDTMSSEEVICKDSARCIAAGTQSGTTCTWKRKLCVTCRDDNGVTKIRVQTNNLPDHCVSPGNNLPKAKNFDFEVMFNKRETHGNWVTLITNQEELNEAVCPIAKKYNKNDLGIDEFGDQESRNAAGVAINGVVFQFANQIEEDPASPITETNEQPLDMCLGHNQRNSDSGMYHYHHLTPCLNPNFLDGKTMAECVANNDCNADKSAFSRSAYEGMKYKQVIGIAKFGHVMYGPYNATGALWRTDEVDACNGAWSDNEYFYVGTAWHPYLVGCQGPSNFPQQEDGNRMFPQCSANGMDVYATGDSSTSASSVGDSSAAGSTTIADDSTTIPLGAGDSSVSGSTTSASMGSSTANGPAGSDSGAAGSTSSGSASTSSLGLLAGVTVAGWLTRSFH